MKSSSETAPDVDAGWDDDDAPDATFGAPSSEAPEASEVDAGWDDAAELAAPKRLPRGKTVSVLGSAHRTLSKKERRELERRQRAHAKKQESERKRESKREREARRQREAAEQLAKRQAESTTRVKAPKERKRPPQTRAPKPAESGAVPVKAAPAVRHHEPKPAAIAQSRQAEREKSRQSAARAPWIFAIVVLAIVLALALLRR